MSLLFDAPLISGLKYKEALISSDEEQQLLGHLLTLELAPFRFHGFVGKRRTQSFGWRYDFEDASFTRTQPLPEWLEPLRSKAATFAGLQPDEIVHALIARYDAGAGIGWHRDRDLFENVVGISLASPAVLRFRQRTPTGFRRANVELMPRSAYWLSGEIRWDWEHSISGGDKLRFSITLRTLSDKGRRIVTAS